MKKYDVIIIGAGAAGLSAAKSAIANGARTLVLDMGDAAARKVSVSGGGRCNFTNMAATRDRYFGKNPDFVRSVIATVTPSDILNWVHEKGLHTIEKAPGQFFCSDGASAVVDALMNDARGADIKFKTRVTKIEKQDDEFIVTADKQAWIAKSLIIATGGTSYPNLIVSDFGYVIAKQFGHKIVPIEPGLVALKTDLFSPDLSGISMNVQIKIGKKLISDPLLFTHFGIGGPAAYRASLHDLGSDFNIDFAPGTDIFEMLSAEKKQNGKKSVTSLLAQKLPSGFAKWIWDDNTKNVADYSDKDLRKIANRANNFIIPGGSLKRRGMQSAEVTIGGVAVDQISSKTMESKLTGGLFFAGEVMDVTGDLGGFNLHFAWASGRVAGNFATSN